jgi:hypothetical protein
MPRVLLIGGTLDLYRLLAVDPRWTVQRAVQGDSVSRDLLGDPRRWDLIVDDAEHYDFAHSEGSVATVTDGYLGEAKMAHRVRLVGAKGGPLVRTVPTEGHLDLAFRPTEEPEATFFTDFVRDYAGHFDRTHLDIEGYDKRRRLLQATVGLRRTGKAFLLRTLFRDSYENPLIAIDDDVHAPVVYIMDLRGDDVRARALEHLCKRTVAKLWPRLFSDLFTPITVEELQNERDILVAKTEGELTRIEAAILAEQCFFRPFAALEQLADEPLKVAVMKIFQAVSFDVTDLDAETVGNERKSLDLRIEQGGWQAFVEVRSSGKRAAQVGWLERFDRHAEAVEAKYGKPTSKLFVLNGMFFRAPAERTDKKLFSVDVVDEAKRRGMTLISAGTLLKAFDSWRNEKLSKDQFLRGLQTPGVFRLPGVA